MRVTEEMRDSNGQLPTFAWPGGYPLVYYAKDDGNLCAKCANAFKPGRDNDEQLEPVQVDVYYEGPPVRCENCNAEIASAYGDPDSNE